MPKPLPREVQNAIIAAVESGMPVSEVTVKFGVARRTIYYYLRRARLLAASKRPTNPSRAPAAEAGGLGGRLPWKCGTVGGEYWGLPVALAVAAAP